jgi:hypothetical protein
MHLSCAYDNLAPHRLRPLSHILRWADIAQRSKFTRISIPVAKGTITFSYSQLDRMFGSKVYSEVKGWIASVSRHPCLTRERGRSPDEDATVVYGSRPVFGGMVLPEVSLATRK